ncbi:MAG TPA: ATPase [Candidatus Altiarchaeales archaeon]|nr:ATPase [Candidatus Altiarchaeales archaeon]
MPIMIRKESGRMEEFKPEKLREAVLRSGASEELASEILEDVNEKLYNGISTREIFRIVHQLLDREGPSLASRYDLKGAIMRLGPEGFAFETYIGEVLRDYGYRTKLRQFIRGRCVEHEIDVIAEDLNGKKSIIECKYHNAKGIHTGLKVVLYTYTRFLDLIEGFKDGRCEKFDEVWLVTNTRFSSRAIQYAGCKGVKLLGWRYPPENTLERRIESKGLYPVTILRSVDTRSRNRFFDANLILAKDLIRNDFDDLLEKTHLEKDKLREIVTEARDFYN